MVFPKDAEEVPVIRRQFILLIGSVVAAPSNALCQVTQRRPLVAFFFGTSANTAAQYLSGFRLGLKDANHVEGQDIDLTIRYANGDLATLPLLANEIIKLQPIAIVTGSTAATVAVARTNTTIPIICAALTDPIGTGLAGSYSRPGGNVTGILNNLDSLPGKRIELARQVVPGAQRLGILMNGANESNTAQRRDTATAADALGVDVIVVDVRRAIDIEAALRDLARQRVQFVLVLQDPMFNNEGKRIAKLAIELRMPTMHGFLENVEDGGLISYGINLRENFRRAAYFVSRLLEGSKPADLPIELPSKLDLVINLKTAKALGLTVPTNLFAIADEVIE